MTKVTVDSELRSKLNNFSDLVEVCDEDGRVVGFFHPITTGDDEGGGVRPRPFRTPKSNLAVNNVRGDRYPIFLPTWTGNNAVYLVVDTHS